MLHEPAISSFQSDPLMHEALELFTSGTLKDYQQFVKKNPTFVTEKLKVCNM